MMKNNVEVISQHGCGIVFSEFHDAIRNEMIAMATNFNPMKKPQKYFN